MTGGKQPSSRPHSIRLDEVETILHTTRQQAEVLVAGVGGGSALTPVKMRQLLDRKGFRFPTKNILFHCLKGGASKTTLAYNTAFRLSQLGARVLLVDLDKQANATQSFERRPVNGVFVDAVTGAKAIDGMIVPVHPHLDLLPSSLDNARLEMELIHRRKNPRAFYRGIFAPVRDRYDILIFDLPPDLSHNTYLCTLIADTVCIPLNADEYSVAGMRMTLDSIRAIQEEYQDLEQEVLVIWSKFDPREKSGLRYLADLKDIGKARLLPIVIRTDVHFKHAQSRARSVFELGKRSNAREDIDILARELCGLREFFDGGDDSRQDD